MKYVELFAGIGGFRVGLEMGFGLDAYARGCSEIGDLGRGQDALSKDSQRGANRQLSCVFANEYDKYARSVYRYHFGDIDGRDIRDVPPGDIPDADLWTFGAPCQDFSVAGRRAGLEGDRGNLFLYTLDLIEAKRPRYFLAENVPGLLSIDGGKAFANIIGQIAQMGYDCQWVCLNSKDFGVPQNRERLFVVGHSRGETRPEILSFGSAISDSSDHRQSVNALDANYHKSWRPNGQRTMIATPAPLKYLGRNQKEYTPECALTVDGANTTGVRVQSGIRRLTPLETERLQAFPDKWTAKGIDDNGKEIEISDTQRYKMAGNAVTTNVIAHFGRAFERLIRDKEAPNA